jgi:DNA-binding transcriptional LysR family regulator
VELYQLRGFVAVAELGHLTRAAERLHVSQPALSAQIKALEDELGVTLFDRVPTGMALTAAGHRLLPEAMKVVAAAQALRGAAASIKGEIAGRVRLGTLADPTFIRLGELLTRATERYPLLDVELHHEISGVAFDKVRDGDLDGSFYYGDRVHPDVANIELRPMAYRIAAPAAWAPALEGAPWQTIAEQPWIIPPPISTHHVLAASLFATRGGAPPRLIEADNEAVLRSLVIAGIGIALMREDLALQAQQAGEIFVWSDTRLETSLQFVYPRLRADEPVIAALRGVIADVWSAPPAAPANETALVRAA